MYWRKILFYCFWVPREINSCICNKTQWQMILLVSGRHVVAHLDGHQHGFTLLISVNLGKKIYPHILLKQNCCDLNLGESLSIFTFFLFPDSGRFWFWFWCILNSMTLKTSDRTMRIHQDTKGHENYKDEIDEKMVLCLPRLIYFL